MLYEKTIRVLYIDMSARKIRIDNREDLKRYMGGVGVASKLLEENMRADLPSLDPCQPIILAAGAMSGIYPALTKVVAMFILPLTGELGESYTVGQPLSPRWTRS
jgi:aldehyde:ferredoxin oxidoreductase